MSDGTCISRAGIELTGTPPYSTAFISATGFILPHENAYARGHWGDPNFVVAEHVAGDAGGTTKYGIDAASHPGVDVENLNLNGALAIYWSEWQGHRLDEFPDKIAVALFDVWVNGGTPVLWLQDALNHTSQGHLQLDEDGEVGPKTLAAVAACDQASVLAWFIHERDARFERLAELNANDRQFLQGWEQRDIDLAKYLSA